MECPKCRHVIYLDMTPEELIICPYCEQRMIPHIGFHLCEVCGAETPLGSSVCTNCSDKAMQAVAAAEQASQPPSSCAPAGAAKTLEPEEQQPKSVEDVKIEAAQPQLPEEGSSTVSTAKLPEVSLPIDAAAKTVEPLAQEPAAYESTSLPVMQPSPPMQLGEWPAMTCSPVPVGQCTETDGHPGELPSERKQPEPAVEPGPKAIQHSQPVEEVASGSPACVTSAAAGIEAESPEELVKEPSPAPVEAHVTEIATAKSIERPVQVEAFIQAEVPPTATESPCPEEIHPTATEETPDPAGEFSQSLVGGLESMSTEPATEIQPVGPGTVGAREISPKSEPPMPNEIGFCTSCGQKLRSDFVYCPRCGLSTTAIIAHARRELRSTEKGQPTLVTTPLPEHQHAASGTGRPGTNPAPALPFNPRAPAIEPKPLSGRPVYSRLTHTPEPEDLPEPHYWKVPGGHTRRAEGLSIGGRLSAGWNRVRGWFGKAVSGPIQFFREKRKEHKPRSNMARETEHSRQDVLNELARVEGEGKARTRRMTGLAVIGAGIVLLAIFIILGLVLTRCSP